MANSTLGVFDINKYNKKEYVVVIQCPTIEVGWVLICLHTVFHH